jgi:hypothetical protein
MKPSSQAEELNFGFVLRRCAGVKMGGWNFAICGDDAFGCIWLHRMGKVSGAVAGARWRCGEFWGILGNVLNAK